MAEERVDSRQPTVAPTQSHVNTLHEAFIDRAEDDPPRPWRLGRYVVLEQIGSGGMSVVYAAIDPELDRRVAVKLMHDRGVRSGRRQDFLLREAQALARLAHPNIVAIFDVGVHEGDVFVAMEFVRGQDLRAWLADRPRTWQEVLAAFVQAGRGLAAAHRAGLVHRDVKPDNLLVGADGRVRVADFGLVRLDNAATLTSDDAPTPELSSLTHTVARPGDLIGTPAYMSPEQFDGGSVDALSDQFSFCVALWEALFHVRPFHGANAAELATAIRAGEPRRPAEPRDVPAWLERTIRRGLCPRPGARWADMPELLNQLDRGQNRRRWRLALGATAGALVLALGGYGLHRAAQQRAIAACVDEGSQISADWNESTRDALERSFLATGKPYAAAVVVRTVPWLDGWTASWRGATVTACRAHTIEASWDADLHARAKDCLDDARGGFRALAHELVDANPTTLSHATSAAATLAPVGICLDPTYLRERPIMHPAQRAAVSALRARLAQAAARSVAGEAGVGLVLAREVVIAARATGWAALVAEAERNVADLEDQSGAYAEAEASLLRALAAARQADAAGEALRSTTELVAVVGYRAARHAEGRVWAEAAQTQLELLPSDHLLEQARLHNRLGMILIEMGSYAEAKRLYTSVLAIHRRMLGEQHPNIAFGLDNIGSIHRSMGAYEEAADMHTRALAIAESALGPDHPDIASILTNLSLVREDMGEYEEAIRLSMRALTLRESALGPDHPNVAYYLNNLAVLHYNAGALDESLRLNTRALEIREKALGPDHPLIANSLSGLAGVHLDRKAAVEAKRLLTRALAIEEAALGPTHVALATTLHNLACSHLALGAYAEARRLNLRALAIGEATQGHDHPDGAYALQGLGDIDLAEGHPAEAVAPLERALTIRIASSTPRELAETRFALARALWDADLDRRRARTLAEQAQAGYATITGQLEARTNVDEWLVSHPPPAEPDRGR